jgi:hypothetical protein
MTSNDDQRATGLFYTPETLKDEQKAPRLLYKPEEEIDIEMDNLSTPPPAVVPPLSPPPPPAPNASAPTLVISPSKTQENTEHKTARINPDAIPVLATAVVLVGVLMISSFVVSFSGIYEVSSWTGLPVFLQWLPALFIDAAILAYTIALVVFKARGEKTLRTVIALIAFAGISVVANVAHTVSFWQGELTDFRAWIGVLITAAAPIAVLLAAEEIARLAFEAPKAKSAKA